MRRRDVITLLGGARRSRGKIARSSPLRLGDSVALSTRMEFSVHAAPKLQHNQLMSERSVLCFKSTLRLEWRGEQGQAEAEQGDHRR
jgi:hypothetical protein